MTHVPDPIESRLAREAQHDHAQAQRRGQRIADLAAFCVGELIANGILPSEHRHAACVVLFPILADDLYGLAAVDIPTKNEDR